MLTRVEAIEFIRPTGSGKTEPSFVLCEQPDGRKIEAVVKLSGGCEQRDESLAIEVVAACLAGDLGLPIPEPLLVEIPDDWAELVTDAKRRAIVEKSSRIAFGSRLVPPEFGSWNTGMSITPALRPTAAAIFAFDGIIQNPDRRSTNPNCLVRGDEVRIFDHDLAFRHGLILGWTPPWKIGGLKTLETPGNHIFFSGLKGKQIDFEAIKTSWSDLPDDLILAYEECIPDDWPNASKAVKTAIKLIQDARNNIDGCIEELKRVLA